MSKNGDILAVSVISVVHVFRLCGFNRGNFVVYMYRLGKTYLTDCHCSKRSFQLTVVSCGM